MQTGTLEEVTQGMDISFGHPVWSSDGNTLYVSGGVEATYQLFAIDVAGKKARQITEGVHNYADPFVAGSDLVASRVSMSAPAEIFRVNAKNGKSEQLTFTNEVFLKDIQTGKVEKRWIPTTDGKEMLTWVIYPPFFDESKSYPALLYCQGGPQSAVSQFWSYRWNFQMMAANGYVVIAPNRRGLPSFGQEWNDQISGDWGGQAMQDLLTAADAVSAEPFVDEERMGAVGASFGGYSVYWLAGNHNKRFKAFISHCGLFNLESWYATTEEMFFANHDLGGSYWQDPRPETYLKDSPHLYVDNWDTPILVIHGEKDFRVPVSEGIQAFHAAKLQGIPSRFLYFPDEGHWVLGPQNGMMWQRVFSEWLDKWLK
jgi:dipeptidyl aminopeptidase/acylaminoacyl peptidase